MLDALCIFGRFLEQDSVFGLLYVILKSLLTFMSFLRFGFWGVFEYNVWYIWCLKVR